MRVIASSSGHIAVYNGDDVLFLSDFDRYSLKEGLHVYAVVDGTVLPLVPLAQRQKNVHSEFDFYYEDILIGKLCLFSRENLRWNKMRFMQTVKSELDLFLRLKYLYTKTCYLSITDELTQLYTRRHLKSVLAQEFERAKRYGTIVTIAMIDIDNFKSVNDKYGHLAGDYILKEVSKIFINTLRKTDFVYRYGGEEICILMPETLVEKAFIPLERLRKTIENRDFVFEGKKIKVTVSIGASTYGKEMRDPNELIERADAVLYKAKKSGKNKVVMDIDE